MRIALTGATGFLGRHVLHELVARGLDVVAIIRSVERFPLESSPSKIIQMDIAHCSNNPYEQMGAPDILIHLAWAGLPNYQSKDHVRTEFPVQLQFLKACVHAGLKRLVISGTCFEYGMLSGELTEDMTTLPCTEYGKAKDMLRKELQLLQQEHTFELAWLRLFYLFGQGQSKKSLYSLLEEAISRGERCFDMSGGEQLRDYLPVKEGARLIVETALRKGNAGTVNICSGAPISIRQIVENWIKERGAPIEINLGKLPYSNIEPMAFWGNREKLNALLEGA